MKIKPLISWGWGIAIFYSIFLVLAIASAIYTSTLDYFLVSEDYYQAGIEYQNQIDKVKRTAKLEESVNWFYDSNNQVVKFKYPLEISSGKVVFYRPSNSNLDRYVKIDPDGNSHQLVNVKNWQKGFWKIKVDWEMHGEKYYNEGSIDIK